MSYTKHYHWDYLTSDEYLNRETDAYLEAQYGDPARLQHAPVDPDDDTRQAWKDNQ